MVLVGVLDERRGEQFGFGVTDLLRPAGAVWKEPEDEEPTE